MSELSLRHIRYFVAVAEEAHFGRAAERVGIAQPPLTQQIQKLEQILGEPLFQRRPRVRLTAAGEAFLEGALKVIAQVDQTVADARRAASGASGSLTLGFAASTLLTIVPEAVRRYRHAHPDVDLKLLEMSSASQIAALSDGSIDLGFVRQPGRRFAHLRTELSFSEPLGIVVPSGHRLSGRESIALKEVAQDEFILFPQSVAPGLHGQVMELFYRAGFAPCVVQEAQEWLTIVGLVDAGVGLSIVPASFRRLRWGAVQYIDLAEADVVTTVSLFAPAGVGRPTAQRFVELARAVVGNTCELHSVE